MIRQWSRRLSTVHVARLRQQRQRSAAIAIRSLATTPSSSSSSSGWNIDHKHIYRQHDHAHLRTATAAAARGLSSIAALEEDEVYDPKPRPFNKLMAANRGEIATRIMRAGTELGCGTVGIYSHEDRFTQHRYKADQAFELSGAKSPVAAYLDIDTIVKLCVQNGVEAVHPGYGFLSENAGFAKKLEDAGVQFVGPTVDNL